MGASCYRMAECSLFALVPTRCAADVKIGTLKASGSFSLASVYAKKAVRRGIYGTGIDGCTCGLVQGSENGYSHDILVGSKRWLCSR